MEGFCFCILVQEAYSALLFKAPTDFKWQEHVLSCTRTVPKFCSLQGSNRPEKALTTTRNVIVSHLAQ